jgi:tetratricopeptide (TPR) repeat protein
LLNHTGRLEGAIREYRLSIRSNPQYPYSRLDLGLVEVNKGEFYEAIEQLTRARELATPQGSKDLKANILYGLAAAYANTMNFDTALSDLNEALQLVPNYAEAMQLRASILKQRRR